MRVTLRATFVAAAAVARYSWPPGSPGPGRPGGGTIRDADEPGAIHDRYIVVFKDTVAASDTRSGRRLADARSAGRSSRSLQHGR